MPFRLTRPSDDDVRRVIASQAGSSLTYAEIGQTAHAPPPGWPSRRRSVELPAGSFDAARNALSGWMQYDLTWTAVPHKPPIRVGEDFATVARTLGLWSVNCCRIVAVEDEPGRFAYAIGTLPHHAEIGEERFALTDHGEGVTFEISSFSKANSLLVRVGWPYAEHAIRHFLRDATARILQEVTSTPADAARGR